MSKSLNCFRGNLGLLLCKTFLLFVLFSLTRVLFFAYNYDFFSDVGIGDVLYACFIGLRVDWCLISLICSPTIILYLLPVKHVRFVIFLANLWFFTVSSLAILLNIFDIKYFPFTFRRLGGEIFGQGELFTEGVGVYWNAILLYWHLILFALVLLYFTWRISFKITPKLGDGGKNFSAKGCLVFVTSVALIVFGIRGGFQDRPFKTMHLPIFLGVNKTQFIANNSCLNTIQTTGQADIPNFQFFHDNGELSKKFSPIHTAKNFSTLHGKFAGKNVVILILESFTAQNIGFLDRQYKDCPERTFTPFLDELLAKSLYFDGFANGTISIDGLTSTLIGVPPLFESSFITSAFSCNKTDALPDAVRQLGYSTLFFYGGKKNSCNFDTIRTHAGVEKYVCKYDFFERYPQLIHAGVSGEWGVHDEEWLQFVSEILGETKSPFCAVIFTLSSHFPFKFPEKYRGTFPTGEHPLQEVTAYSDFALRRFFESAQQTDWYGDTIFILVADHVSCATERYYQKSLGGYSIPFAIFDPGGELQGKSDLVAQQIDIMPTILDLVGYDKPYFSFGHSLFEENAPRFAVSYRNGVYQIITDGYVLQFDGKGTIGFYLRTDFLLENNLVHSLEYEEDREIIESFLKSFLQRYGRSLRTNKMTCE